MADQPLRAIFDGDSSLYDRARPDYPAELFADLTELTGLGPGSTVIEIGPGTGQATRSLVSIGAEVTAVELGSNLADVLRTKFPQVQVVNAAFEDWTPPERVDAVTAFTAWHWVDRDVRVERVHAALRPGGHLATVATSHVRGGTADFFDRVQECYLRWDPATDPAERLLPPEAIPPVTDEIDQSPLFGPAVRRRYLSDITYRTEEYLAVLQTYSGHRALDPDRRRGLLDCIASLIDDSYGGVVTKTYLRELRIARTR